MTATLTTTNVTRSDLQSALKMLKTQGYTSINLNSGNDKLVTEYHRLTGLTLTIIEEQTDIEYKIKGAKVVFTPVSDAGVEIMPELLKHEVMSWHLASVKAQIKQAGYIIKKASSKKVSNKINQDDLNLLKELGIEI
jgi:DNA-binding transcriptional regulator LsrR (DeoR family)